MRLRERFVFDEAGAELSDDEATDEELVLVDDPDDAVADDAMEDVVGSTVPWSPPLPPPHAAMVAESRMDSSR